MKKSLPVLLLALVAFSANAQRYDTMDQDQLNVALAKAKSKIVKGIALTGCGVMAGVIGIVLFNDTEKHTENNTGGDSPGNMVKGFAGIGLTLSGIGLVAGGIPTWIVGGVRKKNIEIQLVKFNSPGSASIFGVGMKVIF